MKKVKTFIEKPTVEMAQRFIESGNFLWNSGIFVWHTKTIINAFKAYLPDIFNSFLSIVNTLNYSKEAQNIETIFPNLQCVSIDHGILEHAQNIYIIKSDFGWRDIGTWRVLYEKKSKDENRNVSIGGKILFYEAQDNIVFIQKNKAAVIDGLNDYIIVDTEKALLICKKGNERQIKFYTNDIKINAGEGFL